MKSDSRVRLPPPPPLISAVHDEGNALAYLTDERILGDNLTDVFLDLQLPTLAEIPLLEAIGNDDRQTSTGNCHDLIE